MFKRNCCMPRQCGKPQCECPVVEPTITKCVEQNFCHEVKHVCPIHTHTINRHIYNHTYTPQYTCSEESQVIDNNNVGCQGMFGNNGF